MPYWTGRSNELKLLHISDLHIGKRLYGFDLEDDQRHILSEIIKIITAEEPDAVLIAGDIYDRADPSATAVRIFDDFLSMLAETGTRIFIIYGNHDSASRIAYGSRILDNSGIHISPVYDGKVEPVRLEDEYGPVDIYMLPYIRSVEAEDALQQIKTDDAARNVIISHQFVTSAVIGDSEEMNIGTLDNIDGSLYSAFDYAALGHIHMPQTIKSDNNIRYSGSPLAYSFSDSDMLPKSVTAVELKEKGSVDVRTIPLEPIHRMCTIKGRFDEIINDKTLIKEHKDDYLRVILTDEVGVLDAMSKLQTVFDGVMTLEYEYMKEQSEDIYIEEAKAEGKPAELFEELYKEQHDGKEPKEEQKQKIEELIREIWEDGNETD